jgi:hypothetical protein
MSAEAQTTSAPVEAATTAAPAATELKPKNTHRLNRILRKQKSSLPPRQWHVVVASTEGEGSAPHAVGVPASVVRRLIDSLSEEDKQRAAAGLEPLTATQEALARRAARFGLNISSNAAAPVLPVPTFVVDAETLRRREERVKQPAPASQ